MSQYDPHRPNQIRSFLLASRSREVSERTTDVPELEVENVLPASLLASSQSGVCGLRELRVVLRVCDADVVLVRSVAKPLGCVFCDDSKHAEARLRLGRRMHEQALVDECRERGQHCEPSGASDRAGRFDRERAGEHPEALEEVALVFVQQPVAPVDRGAHRLLARRRVSASA